MLLHDSDRAPNSIWLEPHVRVREQEPFACRRFVSLLQRVWFSQPARGKFRDVQYAKPRMPGCKLVENSSSRIVRTVIYRNDLKVWIINFHECRESSGQFFFLIARREKHRNARALRVGYRCEIL